MTTIVSAFIAIRNVRGWKNGKLAISRSMGDYLKFGKRVLEINSPKIVFLEKEMITRLGESYIDSLPKTTIIPFMKEDMILHRLPVSKVTLPDPPPYETKPSLEYLAVQINKTEWVKKAIEINPYNTAQFIWIDFGIYHIFQDPVAFEESLLSCQEKVYDKVRIASIWVPGSLTLPDHRFKNTPLWFFAGGVFGGDKDKLLTFADRMQGKLEEIIKTGYVTWEMNIWYLVYQDDGALFDPYTCDHNKSILENY